VKPRRGCPAAAWRVRRLARPVRPVVDGRRRPGLVVAVGRVARAVGTCGAGRAGPTGHCSVEAGLHAAADRRGPSPAVGPLRTRTRRRRRDPARRRPGGQRGAGTAVGRADSRRRLDRPAPRRLGPGSLAAVAWEARGGYEVTGAVRQRVYWFRFVVDRADSTVLDCGGRWYVIATDDPGGHCVATNGVLIRAADGIPGLGTAADHQISASGQRVSPAATGRRSCTCSAAARRASSHRASARRSGIGCSAT
jgi:hypothetical protein